MPWIRFIAAAVVGSLAFPCATQLFADGPGAVPAGAQTTQPAAASLQPDEQNVVALIDQMGSAKYTERQAAQQKITALGPSIVPILIAYRDHSDPEIRFRIRAIIDAYRWMMKGQLILHPERVRMQPEKGQMSMMNVRPEKAILKAGDVLVKVNDHPAVSTRMFDMDMDNWSRTPEGLMSIPAGPGANVFNMAGENTFYVLRDGRLTPISINGFVNGFVGCDWDAEKGGNDAVRAVLALQAGRYAESHQRFTVAVAKGLNGDYLLSVAGMVAMLNGDRAGATLAYGKARKSGDYYYIAIDVSGFPALKGAQVSCHSNWLLEELSLNKTPPPDLLAAAGIYFMGPGRNTDLGRQYIANVVAEPDPPITPSRQSLHLRALYWDQRFDDLIRGYDKPITANPDWYFNRVSNEYILRGRLHAGRVAEAVELATQVMKQQLDVTLDLTLPGATLAAALAARQGQLAGRMFTDIKALPAENVSAIFSHAFQVGLDRRFIAERMIRRLDEYMADHPTAAEVAALLAYLYAVTGSTAKVNLDMILLPIEPRGTTHLARPLHCLAAGQYDKAAQLLASPHLSPANIRPQAMSAAVKLLQENLARLDGDRAALKGTVFVWPGPKGGRFAVKNTGEVLLVRADGGVTPTTGPDPDSLPNWRDSFVIHGNTTLYLHHYQTYLLDEEHLRWQPAYLGKPMDDWRMTSPEAAMIIRAAVENHPARGYERHLCWEDRSADVKDQAQWATRGWVVWGFWNDVVIAANASTGQTVDLSRTIAATLKRDPAKPVRVYRPTRMEDRFLVWSDAGAWTMNVKGELTRLQLPLDSNEVKVSLADWPVQDGKLYIGVAPQQGGQVVEYDPASGATRLMKDLFCGLGPNDALRSCLDWEQADAGLLHNGRGRLSIYYVLEDLTRKARAADKPDR